MSPPADRASLLADLAVIYGEGSPIMDAYAKSDTGDLVTSLENARAARAGGGRLRRDWQTSGGFEEEH